MDDKTLRAATICAIKDQVSCELEGEAVILQMSAGTYFGLNEAGCRIWSIIQQPRRFEEIVSRLIEEYEVDRAQMEADLRDLLLQMLDAGLVEVRIENVGTT
jgi:hypothetical protein